MQDVEVLVAKQGVSDDAPHAKKARRDVDEHILAIKEKVAALEKSVHKRIDKLQGSINYVGKCVEDFNENFAAIMGVVKDNQTREVAGLLPYEACFPFDSIEETDAYLAEDPDCVKLIERYVCVANPSLKVPPPTGLNSGLIAI